MDIEKAMAVLEDNNNAVGNSFLDHLHEQCQFNEQAYWEYYESLIVLGKNKKWIKTDPIMEKIVHTYTYILRCFIYHFDKTDLYEIKEIPIYYTDYLDRLNTAFEAFFKEDE